MIFVFGEILFDVFPDGRQMGGAPFNFAFHMKKLGLPVRFFSRVGNDDLGGEILEFLSRHGFDPSDIQTDPELPTGTVQVKMDNGGHEFVIEPHTAWSRFQYDKKISQAFHTPCQFIYFGSLIQHYPSGRELVQKIAQNNLSSAVHFCDINLRSGFYTPDSIFKWLSCVDILKLNQEELFTLTGKLQTGAKMLRDIRAIMDGYNISSTVLTMGDNGSLWTDQKESYRIRSGPVDPIIDTVGAGDAFAAVFTAGVLNGLDLETNMKLADRFAKNICGMTGALPENDMLYHEFKKRINQA